MSDATSANPILALSHQIERLTDAVAGAVVAVQSRGRPVASGFAWRPDTIVTASDALEHEDELAVIDASGKAQPAKFTGRDPTTDIAVLRLDSALEAAPLSPGASVRVGSMVLALGRGGEGVIANLGMVSVAGGAWQSRRGGRIDSLIRLDTRLDPRAEGGIVVDGEGRLLGMPVFGPRHRALVIPLATIDRIAPKLLADGRIQRGYLGVGLHPIRLDEALAAVHALPERRASMVVNLDPDGPARKAGVLLGDVIVALDGQPVPGVRGLRPLLGAESVGKSAELKMLRAGQLATARVTIGASPAT